MYKCANCNQVFDEPKCIGEDYGWQTELGWHSAYQYFEECPCCGSGDFYEIEECLECGDWFPKDEMTYLGLSYYICRECKEREEEENEY